MDPVTLSLIIAGIGAVGGYATRRATRKANEANIKQANEMFEKEKNLAQTNWQQQNMYNSPEQQMIRLKQAGLNPNLVYGRGADNTAQAISTTKQNMVNRVAPTYDTSFASNALGQYYQIKAQSAQTDNTKAMTDLQKANTIKTEADTAKTLQETARSKYDMDLAKELRDQVVTKSKLENELMSNTIQINMDRNKREELANTKNLELTTKKILTEELTQLRQKQVLNNNPLERRRIQVQIDQINQAIDNAKTEGAIRKIELDLNKMGLSMKDPVGFRVGANQLTNPESTFGKFKSWLKSPSGIEEGSGGMFDNLH